MGQARLQILVVEDECLLGEAVGDALAEQGFEVRVVGNAARALAHLQAHAACDLLFTDINLGAGIDGVALSVAVRQLRPDLPVVYSSGSVGGLQELQAVPHARFVRKPYDFDRLGDKLRAAAGQLMPA